MRLASLEMGSMGDDGKGVPAEAAGLALMLANASHQLQQGEHGVSFLPPQIQELLQVPDGAGERGDASFNARRSRRSTKDSQGAGRSSKGRNDSKTSHGDHQPTPPNMAPPRDIARPLRGLRILGAFESTVSLLHARLSPAAA